MRILFNLFVSITHFILCYSIFTISIISNDMRVLITLLVLMNVLKILYCIFGRCVLTLYEYNEHFASLSQLTAETLSRELTHEQTEEIVINIAMLIVLNKLLFLTTYNYYIK